jgi:hypothetical protein
LEYATSCSFLNNDGVGPPVETCRLSPAAIRSASATNSCFCLGVKVGERLIRDLVVWAALVKFCFFFGGGRFRFTIIRFT